MSFFAAKDFSLRLRILQNQSHAKNVDIALQDVILTHTIQHMANAGTLDLLVFKGGSMLRRNIIGKDARFSEDLDFNLAKAKVIDIDGTLQSIAEKMSGLVAGVDIRLDEPNGIRRSAHGNTTQFNVVATTPQIKPIKVKIEIDHRAESILEPVRLRQKELPVKLLGFDPASINCLQIEEVIGEKIRASFQRTRLRDLYDLNALSDQDFDKDIARKIAVLKLWEAPESSPDIFSAGNLIGSIERKAINNAYDPDKRHLIPFLQGEGGLDVGATVSSLKTKLTFLSGMTALERKVASDRERRDHGPYEELKEQVRGTAYSKTLRP